jgi:iron complex transport system ATP-binding protein
MDLQQPILATTNLHIGYTTKRGVHTIASNLNVSLASGRLISLVGANGIGKSTLLRTLTGIQRPLEGTVLLSNKIVSLYEKLPPSNLTVFELIALGRQPYTNWLGRLSKEDHLKINEAIALTQIGHLVDQKHYEISDGQLQIVLIARALAQDTPLIILDEPTTHLDLFHKVSVFKLLKKLSQETGKCILFSTHDIELAIQLSDEMIVMTPEEVVQDQPCNLISQGVFDTLFNDASIRFDGTKGTFIIT